MESSNKKCPECYHSERFNGKYCSECGLPFENIALLSKESRSFLSKHPTFALGTMIVLGMAVLTATAFGGYFFAKSEKSANKLTEISNQLDELKTSVKAFEDSSKSSAIPDNSEIAQKMDDLKNKIEDLTKLGKKIDELQDDVHSLKRDVSSIESDVNSIQLKVGY